MRPNLKRALVVFSGGQDSTICLYWAKQRYVHVEALTFDYGQRHSREIDAAATIAAMAGVQHHTIRLGSILRGTSPLTDPTQPLEQYPDFATMEAVIGSRVEKTFVPMRNALFLTIAANFAVTDDMGIIVTGVCEADGANYPDCTYVFIDRMTMAINAGLGELHTTGIRIATPLIHKDKADSILMALDIPGAMQALAFSHTAYDGSYPPTGRDHATVLRAEGFHRANVPDPLILRAWKEGLLEYLPDTPNYEAERVVRYQKEWGL